MTRPISTEDQQELMARALGRLLRDATTEELMLLRGEAPSAGADPDPSEGAAPLPEPSGTDVVQDLWARAGVADARGTEILSAEDREWMRNVEQRLQSRVREEHPTSTVVSALKNAQADKDAPLRSSVGLWTGALGLAAAAALAFFVSTSMDPAPSGITFTVTGERGSPSESGRVVAPEDRGRTLAFSDGSKLELAQASSVRVRETDEYGAEVVVEHGRLRSAVKHRSDTSWSVFAGPYEIQVVGTRFTTDWDPEEQELVVVLDEGSVKVVGSNIDDHVVLEPGQRFVGRVNQTWTVTSREKEAKTARVEETLETIREHDDKAAPREAVKGPPKAKPGPTWSQLLADGKFSDIMAEARQEGIAKCISSCSTSRLRSLADAARYTGELDTAERALLSLRARSPGEAVRAGYLLGSMSEARGRAGDALKWYVGYLREAPGGSFAAEALGGKMRAQLALGRQADAHRTASEYLQRYPSGSSAATARRILNKK